jgi:hypothetical protein
MKKHSIQRAHRWRRGLGQVKFSDCGPLAQSVEQQTFNLLVDGSIPSWLTPSPRRLVRSRTPAFHAGDTGSNPVEDVTQ